MKCEICGKKVEIIFLSKIDGTYVKKKIVCSDCQKKYSLDELKNKIK